MDRPLTLVPAKAARGNARLPGSKSISNRVLLLAAVARGDTVVRGLLDADDTRVMLEALRALGVDIEAAGNLLRVAGAAGPFPVKRAQLSLGNAGTAFRPLTALLSLCGGEFHLSGTARMHERPIGDLVDALNAAGARIEYLGSAGFPPLLIGKQSPGFDRPIRVRGDTSSQFLSALLMAPALTGSSARVEVEGELISRPYVEMTLRLMERFGVRAKREGWTSFEIPAARYVSPGAIFVEGDASAASYFLAAGAIGGGPVRVEGVGRGSIQGDVLFTAVLERMGARVSVDESWIEIAGPAAGPTGLQAFDLDLNHIPDAAMTAAVLALFARGQSTLRNIASWRVKETDRLSAMATELRKLGAQVEEGSDYLKITPPPVLNAGVAIDTYNDHRMAMCFALVCLAGVAVSINDPGCVAKTYPEYFRDLARLLKPA